MPYKSKWKHYEAFKFYPLEEDENEDVDEETNFDENEEFHVALQKEKDNNNKDLSLVSDNQEAEVLEETHLIQEKQLLENIREMTEASHELFYDSLMPFVIEIPNEEVLNYRRELVDLINKYSDLKSDNYFGTSQKIEENEGTDM